MKLVVGLGNPGKKYAGTRHNAGFWWVDGLARAAGTACRHEARFHGEVAKIPGPAGDIWLLKPATYMNESGRAVGALADFFRIEPADILIVHDELDLAPGTVKLKSGGSASSNGVRSVVARLGTRDFWRLRIGIGHPGNRDEVIDYVLQRPSTVDARLMREAIELAVAEFPHLLTEGAEKMMNRLHAKQTAVPG